MDSEEATALLQFWAGGADFAARSEAVPVGEPVRRGRDRLGPGHSRSASVCAGHGLADQTVEGTSVHWTDGYQRADGTWVRGDYATDPDGIVFNNLSYLRMLG